MKETFDILSICIGAILMITTIIYAWITGRMLNETKRMRESQTEPIVFITVESIEGARSLLNLVIQNIGQGAAIDLTFKVEPDILLPTNKYLSETNLIKQGFSRLAPKQRIEFLIASAIKIAKQDTKELHRITASYKDRAGKAFEASYSIDFTELFGVPHIAKDPNEAIVNALKSIHQDIERVSRSSGDKLWVVAYTKKEYEDWVKEQLEDYEEIEKRHKEGK
jgi:hypothetical protein